MIVVVGGSGFVGKNLVSYLNSIGRRSRVISRNPDVTFLDSLEHSLEPVKLENYYSDEAAGLAGCEAVVYLASNSTPASYLDQPWLEAEKNVSSLLRFLTSVGKNGAPHFIYISSGGAIYGDAQKDLISEDTERAPLSPYGLGKKMSEDSTFFMSRHLNIPVTVLRPSNPIGLWQNSLSQGVVGALLRAAKSGEPFQLIGDGSTVRDYFDVRDLCRAIVGTIDAKSKSHQQVWNVGSGTGVSVSELLDIVRDVTKVSLVVEKRPARATDVARSVLDVRKIESTIGWRTRYELAQSIKKTWKNNNQLQQIEMAGHKIHPALCISDTRIKEMH